MSSVPRRSIGYSQSIIQLNAVVADIHEITNSKMEALRECDYRVTAVPKAYGTRPPGLKMTVLLSATFGLPLTRPTPCPHCFLLIGQFY